jgi:branched-chain amino acid transport system substrate-binding protein
MTAMSYVFVCFGPADRGYAAQLAEHLRAGGVPVWLDEYPDLPGRWEQVGQDAIDACAAFAVIMSPDSADAPNVIREVAEAISARKPIFPLLLLGQAYPSLAGVPVIDVSDGRMPPPDRVAALRGLTGTTPPPSSPFPAPSSPYPSSPFPVPASPGTPTPWPGPSSPPPIPPTSVLPPAAYPAAAHPSYPSYPTGLGYPAVSSAGGPYVPGAAPVTWPPTGTGSGPVPPAPQGRSNRGPEFWVVVTAGSAALLLVLVIGAVVLVRVLNGPAGLTPAAASSPSGQPAPEPPVSPGATLRIGVDLPFQGSSARISQDTYAAMELYLKQVDHKAGPYQIELVKYDNSTASKGTWDEATCTANAARHLANPGEVAILGTANSACTRLELRALNSATRPTMLMVSHANTYPGLTRSYEAGEPQAYYPRGLRNFARVVTTDDQQGGIDAGFAASIGATRCFVLDDTEAYGRSIAATFVAAAPDRGVTIVGQDHWSSSSASYTTLFAHAKTAGANCVLLAGEYAHHGQQLIKDKVGVLGPNTGAVKVIAPEGFVGIPELDATAAAEGMYLTFPGLTLSAITRHTVGQKFAKDFTTATGAALTSAYALYGVQALQVVLAAIERSNGTRESIRSAVFSGPGVTVAADTAMLGAAMTISSQTGDCSLRQVTVEVVKNGNESLQTSLTAP